MPQVFSFFSLFFFFIQNYVTYWSFYSVRVKNYVRVWHLFFSQHVKIISSHYICCDRMNGIKTMNKMPMWQKWRMKKENQTKHDSKIKIDRFVTRNRIMAHWCAYEWNFPELAMGAEIAHFWSYQSIKSIGEKCSVFIATYHPSVHSSSNTLLLARIHVYQYIYIFAMAVDEKYSHESKNIYI